MRKFDIFYLQDMSVLLTSERLGKLFPSLVWNDWPQPHSSSLGWTGAQTVSQVLSPNISGQPLWCSCGWMTANPCKQYILRESLPRHGCLQRICLFAISSHTSDHILHGSVVWSNLYAGRDMNYWNNYSLFGSSMFHLPLGQICVGFTASYQLWKILHLCNCNCLSKINWQTLKMWSRFLH